MKRQSEAAIAADDLAFKSVRLHFVYAFLLKYDVDDRRVLWKPLHRPDTEAGDSLYVQDRQFDAFHPDGGFHPKIPWSRKGWMPTIKAHVLFNHQAFKYFDPVGPNSSMPEMAPWNRDDCLGGYSGEKDLFESHYYSPSVQLCMDKTLLSRLQCRVSRLLRLNSDGSGTFTVTLDLTSRTPSGRSSNRLITIKDIDPFLRLTPNLWLQNEGELGSHFVSDEVQSVLKKEVGLPTSLQTYGTPANMLEEALTWLEKTLGAKLLFEWTLPCGMKGERLSLGQRFAATQIPYLMIDACMPQRSYDRLFLREWGKADDRGMNRSKLLSRLAGLCLHFFDQSRSPEFVSSDYVRSEFNVDRDSGCIVPMNPNTQVFSYVQRTGSLCLSKNRLTTPGIFVIPGLLDVIESTRQRWHSLMVANLAMDFILGGGDPDEEGLAGRQRNIHLIRKTISSHLCDPHAYLHDGHLGYDLMDIAYEKLGLGHLRSTLYEKLRLFESYVREQAYEPVDRPAPRRPVVGDASSSTSEQDKCIRTTLEGTDDS